MQFHIYAMLTVIPGFGDTKVKAQFTGYKPAVLEVPSRDAVFALFCYLNILRVCLNNILIFRLLMTDDMTCGIPRHAVISNVSGGQQLCHMHFATFISWYRQHVGC
jgi:hypothetical protein